MTEKSLTRGKLLIVDDDDDSRTILAFLLEDEGWKIAEARNGKEALEKLVTEQPDVLILDNRMPEITGAEVCQRIRQQGIDIPVVLITAYSDLEDLASSLGVRYYLRKPLDLPEVLAKIESAYLENFSGE